MKGNFLILVVAVILVSLVGCKDVVLKTVMKQVEPYFHGPGIDGTQFEKITDKVYTFRWNWYRNLIIVTDAGLVVIDPMNAEMATALKNELAQKFPGKKSPHADLLALPSRPHARRRGACANRGHCP